MSTHRAIATTSKGVAEKIHVLTPAPDPGEVLIHVAYTVLIPTDTYQVDRAFGIAKYPLVLGFGCAGFVKAVSEGVTDLVEGDRVSYSRSTKMTV